MPPIMGAAAFILAAYSGVPYLTVGGCESDPRPCCTSEA